MATDGKATSLAESVVRLLTPENRALLALIRAHRPRSIAALAQLSGRAQPNVTRTLAKLEALGLVTSTTQGRRKVPTCAVRRIHLEIDPYAHADRLRVVIGLPGQT